MKITLHSLGEENHQEKNIYWTKLEIKEILKLKLEKMKYFSFPLYQSSTLSGEIKIKIEAVKKEE